MTAVEGDGGFKHNFFFSDDTLRSYEFTLHPPQPCGGQNPH